MFEEVCLVCGKHLRDDGGAYCSEDCQNNDISSPSISSSSSALSSPNMGYAAGGEVPALMPSVLGSALKSYAGRSGYYVSSSSASSTSWSALTDEEDEDAVHTYGSDFNDHDASDPIYYPNSKSANLVYSINPSALSYTRTPSGINNRSTVPHLRRRLSCGSSAEHVHGVPRSAPSFSHATADEDEAFSDVGFSSGDALDTEDNETDLHSEKDGGARQKYPTATSRPKRNRNRASLPACFSLLQGSSPYKSFRTSPVSSSSNNTIARPSPPTPKLPFKVSHMTLVPSGTLSNIQATPRGRRRETDASRSSRRSGNSSLSRSRSRATRMVAPTSPSPPEHDVRARSSVEQIFDWSAVHELPHRGRATIRRNSSPLPKMMGVNGAMVAAVRQAEFADDRSDFGSYSRPRTRGRARVEDLEGFGTSTDAPGYGNGRSGLVNRERGPTARVPL